MTDQQREIQRLARDKLLAIPNHAEWHREAIERERAAADPPPSSGDYAFQERRQEHIRTLAHLPSEETVRVLGEMLDDPRDDPPPRVPGEHVLWYSTRNCAAGALNRLGIANPPVKPHSGKTAEDLVHAWRQWYAEVKAGTRTFRFEGSDIEHRLGPVPPPRRATKDSVASTGHAPARGAAGKIPDSEAQGSAAPKGLTAWFRVAAVVPLFAAGCWWWWRRAAPRHGSRG